MNDEVALNRANLNTKLNKMTPLSDFHAFLNETERKAERLNYCCRDIDNKLKTTDRYIDQFLPFRMIKEVSSFMEFLLPEDQAM